MKPDRPSRLQRFAERVVDWAELRVEQGERERILRLIENARKNERAMHYLSPDEVLRQIQDLIKL